MSPIATSSARVANRSRASVWLLVLSVALLCARSDGRAQSANALKFFDNYFVTGDYVVAGVGLRGLGGLNGSPAGIARGTIAVSGVPADADIVAAFCTGRWCHRRRSAPTPEPSLRRSTAPSSVPLIGPFSKVLDRGGTAPCWSSGGGTGSSGGARRTFTYRADVRRFFPVDADSGRLIVNGPHEVRVPDSGSSGNGLPIALGASLLVVYRDNRVDPRAPLKSIVVYDGGYTMDQTNESMSQTLRGFYQTAASPTTAARLTHIVGSGQANKSERLLLPGWIQSSVPLPAQPGIRGIARRTTSAFRREAARSRRPSITLASAPSTACRGARSCSARRSRIPTATASSTAGS